MIYWVLLVISGMFEIAGVWTMKKIIDTKNKLYILCLAVVLAGSFSCLSIAMREISMGVAYAIWTGIGSAGGVLVGIIFFKEDKSFLKIFCVCVIIASSVGLKALS
ncbi:multidrug efflux SMR transporter [Helicobacter trogontum]|uniref:Guanidinium exporter n=1 Tax=Helicobacter trogontum TaxID=50960 RepID=A0A4U8TGV0_9HELI|nr:multidrug efflux SMR transporter [Helicobacter trogontum]MCI5786726.1 multidrug efflux SMR transporter [Helicobacter trogontum]MDY5185936.1 multidrug efflux SMR transporter [Helicobacter trogontum]TLD84815.1 multidrug efflux SMR transporter [Helicobacter trogontum]TLD98708.1 multidrug efflux SMR transporter [Helicobacter trogontum]